MWVGIKEKENDMSLRTHFDGGDDVTIPPRKKRRRMVVGGSSSSDDGNSSSSSSGDDGNNNSGDDDSSSSDDDSGDDDHVHLDTKYDAKQDDDDSTLVARMNSTIARLVQKFLQLDDDDAVRNSSHILVDHALKCLDVRPPIGEQSFTLATAPGRSCGEGGGSDDDDDDDGVHDDKRELKDHEHIKRAYLMALEEVTLVLYDLETKFVDKFIENRKEKIHNLRRIQLVISQSLDVLKGLTGIHGTLNSLKIMNQMEYCMLLQGQTINIENPNEYFSKLQLAKQLVLAECHRRGFRHRNGQFYVEKKIPMFTTTGHCSICNGTMEDHVDKDCDHAFVAETIRRETTVLQGTKAWVPIHESAVYSAKTRVQQMNYIFDTDKLRDDDDDEDGDTDEGRRDGDDAGDGGDDDVVYDDLLQIRFQKSEMEHVIRSLFNQTIEPVANRIITASGLNRPFVEIVDALSKEDDLRCRLLHPAVGTFSFRNGIYLTFCNYAKRPIFLPYDVIRRNKKRYSHITSSKYFDVWFPHAYYKKYSLKVQKKIPRLNIGATLAAVPSKPPLCDIPTPLFDSVLKHQNMGETPEERESVMHVAYTLLGRTIRTEAIELDNWQLAPCFIGLGGTGKSMTSEIVQELFHPDMVGHISSTMQDTFGWVGLTDQNGIAKQICILNEMSADKNKIPQPHFLQLLAGEKLEITNKGRDARWIRWKRDVLITGNQFPSNFTNESNQIGRRVVIFLFMTPVLKKDTTLKKRILEQEIPGLIYKWSNMYFQRRMQINTVALKSHMSYPLYFQRTQRKILDRLNSLLSFLLSPEIYNDALPGMVDQSPKLRLHICKNEGCKLGCYMPFRILQEIFRHWALKSPSKTIREKALNINIADESVYSAPFAEFGIRRENNDMQIERNWLEDVQNTLITGPEARVHPVVYDWVVGIGFHETPRNAYNFKEFYREQMHKTDDDDDGDDGDDEDIEDGSILSSTSNRITNSNGVDMASREVSITDMFHFVSSQMNRGKEVYIRSDGMERRVHF